MLRIINTSYHIYNSSTVIISLFFFCWIFTIFPFPKPSSSSHFPLSLISGTMISRLLLFWNLEWILSFLEFIIVVFLYDKCIKNFQFVNFLYDNFVSELADIWIMTREQLADGQKAYREHNRWLNFYPGEIEENHKYFEQRIITLKEKYRNTETKISEI